MKRVFQPGKKKSVRTNNFYFSYLGFCFIWLLFVLFVIFATVRFIDIAHKFCCRVCVRRMLVIIWIKSPRFSSIFVRFVAQQLIISNSYRHKKKQKRSVEILSKKRFWSYRCYWRFSCHRCWTQFMFIHLFFHPKLNCKCCCHRFVLTISQSSGHNRVTIHASNQLGKKVLEHPLDSYLARVFSNFPHREPLPLPSSSNSAVALLLPLQ